MRRPAINSGGLIPSQLAKGTLLGGIYKGTAGMAVRYAIGKVGHCPRCESETIVISDDSESVTGPAGADPVSNRYAEIRIAFEAIAKRCRCGKCKVCVLHFDGVGNVGPTPLKRRVPPRVLNALAPPRTGVGSSNLGPSLAEAARIVAANPTVDQFSLVIFSDFELLDPNVDQILHDLDNFPGEVHLVCLGEQMPPSIAGLLDERITVTTLTSANAPGAVARALLRSMTEDRPGARIADEPEA